MKMIWVGAAALVIALTAGQSGGKTEVAELLPIEVIAVRSVRTLKIPDEAKRSLMRLITCGKARREKSFWRRRIT